MDVVHWHAHYSKIMPIIVHSTCPQRFLLLGSLGILAKTQPPVGFADKCPKKQVGDFSKYFEYRCTSMSKLGDY